MLHPVMNTQLCLLHPINFEYSDGYFLMLWVKSYGSASPRHEYTVVVTSTRYEHSLGYFPHYEHRVVVTTPLFEPSVEVTSPHYEHSVVLTSPHHEHSVVVTSIQFRKLELSHKGQFCCGHGGLVK